MKKETWLTERLIEEIKSAEFAAQCSGFNATINQQRMSTYARFLCRVLSSDMLKGKARKEFVRDACEIFYARGYPRERK